MRPFPKAVLVWVSGVGVGYVAGLSVSAVVGIVLTSLVALIVTSASAIAGLEVRSDLGPREEHKELGADDSTKARVQVGASLQRIEVNPIPVMAVILGIAMGATFGVWVRTHGWLGSGLGYPETPSEKEPVKKEPAENKDDKPKPENVWRLGVLFAATAKRCDDLRASSDSALVGNLERLNEPNVKLLTAKCGYETDYLRAIVRLVCSGS